MVGVWRSLVAHFTGGEGVAGSNPATPTNFPKINETAVRPDRAASRRIEFLVGP